MSKYWRPAWTSLRDASCSAEASMRRAERTRSASATRPIARIMVVSTRMFLSLTAETSTPLGDSVSTCLRLFGLVCENKRAFASHHRPRQDVASKQSCFYNMVFFKEVTVSSQKLSRPDVVSSDKSEISSLVYTTKYNFRLRFLDNLLRPHLA